MSDLESVVAGLTAIVVCKGSLTQASEQTGIEEDTLRVWRDELYPQKYEEIRLRNERVVEAMIVEVARDNALRAAQATAKGINAALEALEDSRTRPAEKAQIALNLSKVMGTNVDKVLALTGRPVDGTDSGAKNALDLVRSLVGSGVVKVANLEAFGEGDDRVVEGSTSTEA